MFGAAFDANTEVGDPLGGLAAIAGPPKLKVEVGFCVPDEEKRLAAKGLGCAAPDANGCPEGAEPADEDDAPLAPKENVGVADNVGVGEDENGEVVKEFVVIELIEGADNGDDTAGAPN